MVRITSGITVVLSLHTIAVAAQGNSACAKWCAAGFTDPGADCTSLAAKGGGPCYQCGPSRPNPADGMALCAQKCVDTQTDVQNCGACGKVCAGLCIKGVCAKNQCETPSMSCLGPYKFCSNGLICAQRVNGQRICVSGGDYVACVKDSDCNPGLVCLSEPNQDCRTTSLKPGTCGYYSGNPPISAKKRRDAEAPAYWGLRSF
ncbi:hypothetical protein FVEN_g13168 [Fusarium venenatum]|uniref:4Fe-4S ferredoxin-type domain-containing protein n=1 Tax=Fusarium venenatum TaxID=56646 RepID=A0A2L2TDG0_9HYPO|nr:uncharacterized protein FVRRES_08086 [Fusarium venenatum]KAG8354314.1 hypothetical protein FVEN_g13168 [Fusarium venenatum]KAH6964873.1 hypothetical protein EDB82DRAFT_540145 [Fusarium venenatum]CEI68009.1 unnamed protein product [Fusarium venenatum]